MLPFPRLPLPLLILASTAFSAYSQPTSVVLSARQARRIADSLAVLPVVRREAATWQRASQHYAVAADSLAQAAASYQQALHAQQAAFEGQRQLAAGEAAQAQLWRRRARRRGLLNWLGLALAGGTAYLLLGR